MVERTSEFWHERFVLQASWSASLREYLLRKFKIRPGKRILEVGSGTSAVLNEVQGVTHSKSYGLDINRSHLSLAKKTNPNNHLIQGNGFDLPFLSKSFDLTYCHFFLLWVNDPLRVMNEMMRVTRNDGYLVAFAEPDYDGRIDYPAKLEEIGKFQAESIRRQGADPHIGRKLKSLFNKAGLHDVHVGILGGEWNSPPTSQEWESEWATLKDDLRDMVDDTTFRNYKNLDAIAWQTHERVLFVPTFYAWGKIIR